MGFSYFDGKTWEEITREERFFCLQLYNHIVAESTKRFVAYLRDEFLFDLSVAGEWEVGFEVCFYRDLWQFRGRQGELLSPKRTFDLCLFGTDEIVIIEAKAAQSFELDQTNNFMLDIDRVARLTSVKRVHLIGLCSSKYRVEPELESVFASPILRWIDLAGHYGNDPVLLRADAVFEGNKMFSTYGRNSDRKMTGTDLVAASKAGNDWWVGRGGGLHGARFQADVRTGQWRNQKYEVNTTSDQLPSQNWFRLADFVSEVEMGK